MFGSIVAMIGMLVSSIPALLIGCFVTGIGLGYGHFYRFAVIELSPEEMQSWAMSTTLSSGCISGFLGPTLGLGTSDMFPSFPYAGPYLIMCLLGVVNLCALYTVKDISGRRAAAESTSTDESCTSPIHTIEDSKETDTSVTVEVDTAATLASLDNHRSSHSQSHSHNRSINHHRIDRNIHRPLLTVIKSARFLIPCALTTLAQTIMFVVMVNVGLEMKSLSYTYLTESLVFDLHFFFMFFPGFFTGNLINQFGPLQIAFAGFALMAMPISVLLSVTSDWGFYISMISMGVAWNFAFTGGTVLLSWSYSPTEKTAAQAVNDVAVFGLSSLVALLSGLVLSEFGWTAVLYAVLLIYVVGMTFVVAAWVKWGHNLQDFSLTVEDTKSP
mmetsp:Transcript_29353/g.40340  ORF Transcript_29353/g.40340 Transcript_29353/m.40340 type:complete len:386 (-) Transcript_29353:1102-2259(-)